MSTAASILALDIGGTKTALTLYLSGTWEVITSDVFPTDAKRGFAAVQADLCAAVDRLRQPDTVAIGIGIAGLIHLKNRLIAVCPNIPGAEQADLRGIIQKRTGLKTVIENDARCFTYGEARLGAGRGHSVVVGVTLGTGVGGGIVVDGKILQGANGFAGELGHMLLVPGQLPYASDDKRGDVEQYLSGTAMRSRCESATAPTQFLEGQVCGFMHADIQREVAWFVASLTAALDPSVIVFGGSAGRALRPHLESIEKNLRGWLIKSSPVPLLKIAERTDSGLLGAALLAEEAMR